MAEPVIKLQYGQESILVARPDPNCTQRDLRQLACSVFPELRNVEQAIYFETDEFRACNGTWTTVSVEALPLVIPSVTRLKINVKRAGAALPPLQLVPRHIQPAAHSEHRSFSVTVRTETGQEIQLDALSSDPVYRLKEGVQDRTGICPDSQRLIYAGKQLEDYSTLVDNGITGDATIYLVLRQRGGKPVIYVFSPIEREVSVKLSLVPQWELSAIYPVVPVKHSITSGQELEWVVRTSPCGTLTEKTTGLDVSYLFWEAETTSVRPPSPPPSPQLVAADGNATELFVPNEAHLSDDDSVLVQTSQITPYLDSALKSLGLHTEARTSFITYWLPSILKHQYIALRFLPQSAYEKAAPLRVTPSPDVVLRIFMLFKGVQESQLGEWTNARTRQNEDVSRWRSVVGADVDLATNFDLFRVIEWGGMEVKDFVGA